MPELVIMLPDDVVYDVYDRCGDQPYVWDSVADLDGRDIVALYFLHGPFPHGVEEFHFPDPEDARNEAWRLNKALGLSNDEIVARIEEIMQREYDCGVGPNLIMPDDIAELTMAFDEKYVQH